MSNPGQDGVTQLGADEVTGGAAAAALPRPEWRSPRGAAAAGIAGFVLLIVAVTIWQILFQAGQYPVASYNLGDLISGVVAVTAVVAALLQLAWRLLGRPAIPVPAPSGRRRRRLVLAAAGTAALIWIVPLGEEWSRSMMQRGPYLWHIASAGGFLQVGDAGAYYYDARILLHDLPIRYTRRPFAATFLSSWLLLTGNRLTTTLVLNALMIAAATATVSAIVARRMGWSAALLFWAVVFSFAFPVIGTTLTEPVGLLLGLLGAGFLLAGALDRHPRLALIGIWLAVLGIDTRAGALLVMPCLVVWFTIYFGGRWPRWLQRGAIALAVALAAPAVNWILNGIFAEGSYQRNAGHFIYAFTHNTPLPAAIDDNPEYKQVQAGTMPEQEFNRILIQRSLQRLRERPSDAARAAINGLKIYGSRAPGGFLAYFTEPNMFAPYNGYVRAAGFILAALGLGWFMLAIRQPIGGLGLLAVAGVVVSAPLIITGGYRVFAATAPFDALLVAAGLSLLSGRGVTPPATPASPLSYKWLRGLTAAVLIMGVAIPVLRKPFIPAAEARDLGVDSTTLLCRPGTESPVLSVVNLPGRGFLEGLWPGRPHRVHAAEFAVDEGLRSVFPGIPAKAAAEAPFELIDALQVDPQGLGTFFYIAAKNLGFPRDGRLIRFHLLPGWDPVLGWPVRRAVSFEFPES